MSYKDNAIAEMLDGDRSGRLRALHDQLVAIGLKTAISSGTETLLFKAGKIGLVGFRSGSREIFSFSKPYWVSRVDQINTALKELHPRHLVETEGFVSSSQYSVRQVRVSEDTFALLQGVVSGLVARHVRELRDEA